MCNHDAKQPIELVLASHKTILYKIEMFYNFWNFFVKIYN